MSYTFAWHCDECDQAGHTDGEFEVNFEVDESGVPQFELTGFHIHVQNTIVPVSFTLWASFKGLVDLVKKLGDKHLEMEMEERMRQLIHTKDWQLTL